jgi:type I restriction enzyme, S subunit
MAANDWAPCRLGDLVEIKHGWPFKSELFAEDLTGLPIVVGVGNFRYTGGFRFGETSVKEYRGNYPGEFELAPGDILLVMTCQTAGGEILGIPARVPSDGRTYLHNQRLGKVVVRDSRRVDLNFLYWLFLSREFNRELVTSASGTKILHTAPTRIEAFRFDLPPFEEQRAIAHVLGALDVKIELNRRMSETLEAIARALFKSWFVDFDPVRAKAGGKSTGLPAHMDSLFPRTLVETDGRDVPNGWEFVELGGLCNRISMGPFGSDIKTENFVPAGVPVIRGMNLTDGFIDEGFAFLTESKADELRSANAFPGDIVITHRGTLGQVGLIPDASRYARYVVSQSQMVVSVKQDGVSPVYIYLYLTSPAGQHALLANTSQTGVPAISRPVTSVKTLRVLKPPFDVAHAFSRLVSPIWRRIISNRWSSATTSSIRDALLPKLISGELRVRDAEKFIGRAA